MTREPMTDAAECEFLSDRFRRAEPKRCMYDLDGECNNPPVEGHFMQEGLLKLIQDSERRVISFYNLKAANRREMAVEYALNQPIRPKEAAKRLFLCEEHERFFWPLENPGPNWNDPEHKARLAYRTCLINRYFKEWAIRFADPFLPDLLAEQRQQLNLATPLESATRNYLNRTEQDHLRHVLARIRVRPRIAATGVIMEPLAGTHFTIDVTTDSYQPDHLLSPSRFSLKRESKWHCSHMRLPG